MKFESIVFFFLLAAQVWVSHSFSFDALSETELLNFVIGWILLEGVYCNNGEMASFPLLEALNTNRWKRWPQLQRAPVQVNFVPVLATKKRKKNSLSLTM